MKVSKFNPFQKKTTVAEFQLGIKGRKKEKVHPSTKAVKQFMKKGKTRLTMPKS